MSEKDKKRQLRRRNPKGKQQTSRSSRAKQGEARRRNPPAPRTTVSELALEAGLVGHDGKLSRSMADIAIGFLQPILGDSLRWDSRTGEPRVLAKARLSALDALTHLVATARCLFIPPGAPVDWYGCTPSELRQNPTIDVDGEPVEFDCDEYDDYEEDEEGEGEIEEED